jgi:peptide/nickel transport system permease protein
MGKQVETKQRAVGPWRIALERFLKNRVAVVGAVLFLAIVLSVIIVPIASPYELSEFALEDKEQAPSAAHWLGTDEQGRDVVLRLFYGGRISILVGLMAAGVSVILGAVIGGISGYYGGRVDNLLMRFAEIVYSIPFTPTVISISAALMWRVDSSQKMFVVMLLIGILSWPGLARIVRSQILSLREQEFMQATQILGISDTSKIFKHLLPNTLAFIIVSATLGMASAILTEAGLSYLGLGVTPPTPTWGNMIERARNNTVFREMQWLWIPPGVMIMLTVVSINLLGEGLRDAFDPKEIR